MSNKVDKELEKKVEELIEKKVEDKKSGSSTILVVVLVLISLAFAGYVLFDKGVVSIGDGGVKISATSEEKNDSNIKSDNNGTKLSVSNGNVLNLFDMAHGINGEGYGWRYFENNSTSVSDMDYFFKSYVAATTYGKDVLYSIDTVTGTYSYYVDEEDVKKAFDVVFGEGYYKKGEDISYKCGSLKYNAGTNQYTTNNMACGGLLGQAFYEKVIDAVKYNDRIEITSAVGFEFAGAGIYKDSKAQELLSNEGMDLKNYVNQNTDKLYKYKYTFKLNSLGFYNFEKVEKVSN